MPVVSSSKSPKKIVFKKPDPIQVSLPEEPSEVVHDFDEYAVLLHGEKKWGKTTLSIAAPDVFLLTFDPVQKSYAALQRHCPGWPHFLAYLTVLEQSAKAGTYRYKRVVLDGADLWYRACQDYACRRLGIEHPSDADWGKGWDGVKQEFTRAVDRFLALPGGKWFISHSTEKEVQVRRGPKIEKLVPMLPKAGEEILVGKIDAWFACVYDGDEHVCVVRGDERTGAGCRIKDHFLTPAGDHVFEVPMGQDEYEGWENLLAAFHNEQPFATLAERDEAVAKAAAKGGKKKSA